MKLTANPGSSRRAATRAALACVLLALAGCSPAFYGRQADRDSYNIIHDRQREVVGRSYPLDIEPTRPLSEELNRRDYAGELPPEALADGDAAGVRARPVVLAAGPRVSPPDAVRQMSILFSARDPDPLIGVLVDGALPAATTGPAAPAATQPEALAPVHIEPIRGGGGLFIEPDRWPDAARRIDLVTALQLAAVNNREFQTAKETVYRAALALTGERHNFESQFFGTVDASLDQTAQRTRSGTIDSAIGLNRTFKTGGAVALSISNTLFEVFTDPTGKSAASAVNLTLSQPILRGAGYRVAAEPLVQADREVTYAIRTFERLKRQLAVSIATELYRVLQRADEVGNERNNYANLIRARERTEALAEDRMPQLQVDQARQDELRARNRWVAAVQRYNQAVDEFRRTLGVPTDWPIVPDPASLARLSAEGLRYQAPQVSEAVRQALGNRLDLKTARDEVIDAGRRVHVTGDALKGGLDLSASAMVPSNPDENRPTELRFEHGQYSIGALLDLPLDRLDERNAYRSALIDLREGQRALTNRIDQVSQEVRRAIRNLVRAENTHRIQESALRLAERRVESTNMLLEAGRAITRDLLEAQAALVEAQNALTGAVVDYHIARLELLRDMETLQVEPAGLTYHDPTTQR